MALRHAKSGEVVRLEESGRPTSEARTETLIKTDDLEVIRLAAPAGKEFPTHAVLGEITVQCLAGLVDLVVDSTPSRMRAGEMAYLAGGTPHAVRAVEDASVLLTILLRRKSLED